MTVKTVDNGLLLLQHLVRSEQPCAVGEVARDLRLPKSNAHRLLNVLVDHGFVRQRPDTRYEPTFKLWELGAQVVARTSLTRDAPPVLERLARTTGESAQLAVLDGAESIYVDKRDGPHPVSGFTRIGTRAPAHCCATGKVELALRGPEALAALPPTLRRYTAATVRTRRELAEALAEIRNSGVAVNRGEWVDDVWGVAAAIRNHSGAVCASIGVWGPRERISVRLAPVMRDVREAADAVSRLLGCPPGHLSNPRRSEP